MKQHQRKVMSRLSLTFPVRIVTFVVLLVLIAVVPGVGASPANAAPASSIGNYYYFSTTLNGGQADSVVVYGKASDTVLVGDWDGDGVDTLAVRRGNIYYVKNSIAGGQADDRFALGRVGDQVTVGDWDGDGVDTFAVRRSARFYFFDSLHGGQADRTVPYGKPTDEIYSGDWDADGIDTIIMRRGNAYLGKNTISGGEADFRIIYGRVSDYTLVGDWDGKNGDTVAVRRSTKPTGSSGSADSATDQWNQKLTMKAPANVGDYVSSEAVATLTFANGEADALGEAWASNSVNATAFRHSSIVTQYRGTDEIQTAAYYGAQGQLMLARRNVTTGEAWQVVTTQYTSKVTDAHNSISIAVDGDGYLHVAWGMHVASMQYAKSTEPWSLNLGKITPLTGKNETQVTYPEFYQQSNGDLFFVYRFGSSGNGNMVIDHYSTAASAWTQVSSKLIDGSGSGVSPYWQAVVDSQDRLQISWVWRATGMVETNHDLMYARSTDATGTSWETSQGQAYTLPITKANAEIAQTISQGSELMNQTSMTIDSDDQPYIVSYWKPKDSPVVQYMVAYLSDAHWTVENTGLRTSPFSLSGSGSKALPIARPQILVAGSGSNAVVHLILRDVDFGSRVVLANSRVGSGQWSTVDLTTTAVGLWEPSFDVALWQRTGRLDLFIEKVNQVDGEGIGIFPASYAYVLHVWDNALNSLPDVLPQEDDATVTQSPTPSESVGSSDPSIPAPEDTATPVVPETTTEPSEEPSTPSTSTEPSEPSTTTETDAPASGNSGNQ